MVGFRWWLGVLVAGVVAALAPSAGAAGWVQLAGTPTAASGVAGSPPSLSVDSSGDLWLAFADSSSGTGTAIQVFERTPGGSFASALDLAQSQAQIPRIAAGRDGTAAVAWDTGTVSSGVPNVAIRPPGGTFGTPLQAAAGAESAVKGLAVLPDGTVLLAWTDDTAPGLHVASIARGGSFVNETPTGIGQFANDVRLVTNSAGEAVLSWDDAPASNKTRIAYSARPPGGAFGATAPVTTRTLQAGESSQSNKLKGLALDDAGDLIAVSNLGVDTSGTATETLQAHVRPAGHATFTHAPLDSATGSATSVHAFNPAVVLDAGRRATVVWIDGSGKFAAASTTSAGGTTFSAPASFTMATPGSCLGGFFAPVLAPLAGGGLAGLVSDAPSPPFCVGGPLVPLSPAGGSAVTAQPAIEPTGAWALSLVPDGAGDAFAPVGFTPDASSVPVIAYDATPPTVGAIVVPASVAAGSPASFSVPASDAISGVSVSWSFGDGQSGSGAAVSHKWATPGTYTLTATATDGAGNTAAVSARVVVADRTAPVISNASLAHRSFAVGSGTTAVSARKRAARHRRPARGTAIRFTLSEPATVTLTITHAVQGKRSGKRCVATHSRHIAKHKRCMLTKSAGTLVRHSVAAGADRVAFSGRIGHRKLKPGAYELRIDATDPAGNQAKPQTLGFKVVKG
jgi:PKD domain